MSGKPIIFKGSLVFALMCTTAQAQRDFSEIEVVAEPVTDGIYMLTGSGGNIGLSIGEDATFIIDDQFAPLTEKIQATIQSLTATPVSFVINTHWHGDHVGGNENFGKAGAVIVAHDNVRARMSTDQFMANFNREVKASPPDALPVVTFNDRSTLHLNGDHAHIMHVPRAHTDGDAIVHFEKANVIHMGDTFFNGGFPFIDTGSGGTIDGLIRAADRVLAMANEKTRIIPGHGSLAAKSDLQGYRDMLVGVRIAVANLKLSGQSLEEVIAAKPIAEYEEQYGGGFINAERIIGFVYETLGEN